jgi:TonB family protein
VGTISADTTTYRAREWDTPPAMRRAPLIPYPPELTPAGRHRVTLRFRVLATGLVDSASIVVVSSTEPRLDRYAVEGVRKTVMWPACKDGAAVASLVQQTRGIGDESSL